MIAKVLWFLALGVCGYIAGYLSGVVLGFFVGYKMGKEELNSDDTIEFFEKHFDWDDL